MVASKLAARGRGHGGVSLEMGRKRSGAGFRRGRSDGTGRFRGPASAKTKETPRPLVLRAALDYWHPHPRWKNGNSGLEAGIPDSLTFAFGPGQILSL